MRGPYQHTTAIVIKQNSGYRAVRIFNGGQVVQNFKTGPDMQKEMVMVFLNPSHNFALIENATVKCIM